MSVLGIDLGGTKLSGAVFSSAGDILHKEIMPLEGKKGEEVGALIQTLVKALIKHSDSQNDKAGSLGICVPGISYSKTGRVWAPNIPGWDDYPLLQEINSIAEGKEIKVKIDSDRACYILGETWKGAAQGCSDAIFLAVGTGIGAGILVNGEILRGSNDIAGAIGWLALDRPFLKKYIECGCFEYHSSGEGIAKVAKEFLKDDNEYKGELRNKDIEKITAYDVFAAYEKSDPLAVKVLDQAVEFWGMAAANLVSLFNPEKIIFGGGVFGPAEKFIGSIMQEARKWAQPISINQVKFEKSRLAGDAGLIGAGHLALRNL